MTDRPPPLLGINLPWFDGAYGHDMAPNPRLPTWPIGFSPMKAYRPLVEAREMGFSAVRVWLCENAEGIVLDADRPDRQNAMLIENIKVVQECAALLGLRVYWTLLDGNAWAREGDTVSHAILSDADSCARFADGVAAALARVFDPAVTFAVEVVNEPEALSPDCVKAELQGVSWEILARSIRCVGNAIRAARPGTAVTAGTLHQYLPQFLRADPGVDAIDLHAYHVDGGLPSRQDLARYTGDRRILEGSIPLIAGECGIPDEAPPAALVALPHFVHNAIQYGYDAAFLWRLERVLIDTSTPQRALTDVALDLKKLLALQRG